MALRQFALRSAGILTLLVVAGAPAAAQTRAQLPGPTPGLGGVPAGIPFTQPMTPGLGPPPALPQAPVIRRPVGRPVVISPREAAAIIRERERDRSGHFVRHRHHHGVITTGTGLSVNGSFVSDNFRLGIHLGSPFGRGHFGHDHFGDGKFRHRHGRHHHHKHHFDLHPIFHGPFFHTGIPRWYDYDYGNRYTQIYGFYGPADPNLYGYTARTPAMGAPVTEQPTPSTNKELGQTYLRAGDAKAAAAALRTWVVDNPGDAEAMRLLAVALIESAQLQEGTAMMAMAYRTDPALAARPLPADIFYSADALREEVRRVSIYANRVNTASAWLSLAALMQAEGREAVARSMIEKARAAGLEKAVADRFMT